MCASNGTGAIKERLPGARSTDSAAPRERRQFDSRHKIQHGGAKTKWCSETQINVVDIDLHDHGMLHVHRVKTLQLPESSLKVCNRPLHNLAVDRQ
ncbi:hypothetical protein LSAT2_009886 [Lamellibrachia satsuma]|nr:hypothetical protein LSAT2_009886 [Lamellibrachia satsuma]